jgi:hypothetical protein
MLLTGIDAISLVEHTLLLRRTSLRSTHRRVEVFATQSDEKQHPYGSSTRIPNKPIYRAEGEEEFYVYFSSEATIRKAM